MRMGNAGRGFGANELYAMHMSRVKAKMATLKPGFVEQGVALYQRLAETEAKLSAFRSELKRHVGDGIHDAMKLVKYEAEKNLKLQSMQAEQTSALSEVSSERSRS